jgi:hypothetical protein
MRSGAAEASVLCRPIGRLIGRLMAAMTAGGPVFRLRS